MMVTSWMACTSSVRRATSRSRYALLSRRKSAVAFSVRWVCTRASRIGGLMGLVM